MTKLVVSGVLATVLLNAPAAAESAVPPAALNHALADLHDGRFDAAQAALEAAPGAETNPEILFFRAFVTYWRLLYDDENLALRRRLERQLGAVVARTDALAQDASAALWGGSARLLLAQLRAIEKKPLAAATEAKRARKDLNAIDKQSDLVPEALFGLGTYNYMADRVPAFVKGLRALLFLPAGDRALGLRQLDRAARESRWFAVEARLLLVAIAANRHERLYGDALEHAARARATSPDSVVVAHAVAKLLVGLGRWDEAAGVLDPALSRTRAVKGVDPAVVGTLELMRARVDFSVFRADLASSRADALSTRPGRLPAELRADARQLAAGATALTARAWWPEAHAFLVGTRDDGANGRPAPAAGSAERDAVMALLEGRAALAAGRSEDALTKLAEAESSGALPEAWLGPCRLLAGQAADLQGLRSRAIGYYKRAETTPGFMAREAAMNYQARPFKAGTK